MSVIEKFIHRHTTIEGNHVIVNDPILYAIGDIFGLGEVKVTYNISQMMGGKFTLLDG